MDLNLGKLQIVLPASPTPVEKGAAKELAEHIQKITGEEMTVICEKEIKEGQTYIYIGATQFAKATGVTFPDNRFGEGWAIEAIDGNLILCGGAVRGTLYAVYHLLEDVLGVRWWSLWDETIPSLPAALIPANYKNSGVPAMEYRGAFFWPTKTTNPFSVRNRMNGFTVYATPELGSKEDFGHPAHTHTIDRYFPSVIPDTPWMNYVNPDKINSLTDYPQWHAQTARNKRIPGKFCLTNEGFAQEYTRRLLRSIEYSYAKADEAGMLRPRYYSVTLADSAGTCNCRACQESVKQRGLSGHMLHFVNKLADAIAPIYPEVFIETLAYSEYIAPPIDDTKPADNVLIRFAASGTDILRPITHPHNQKPLTNLAKWTALCKEGNLHIWDYGVIYGPNGIFPNVYRLGENFQTYKNMGVSGVFLEIEQCINTDFWDMHVWLFAKFMEDPDLDLNALMDEFIYGYYGAAPGKHIRKYLDFMHEKIETSPITYGFGASIIHSEWLSVEDLMAADAMFDAAFAAADGDETLLRRLRHARHGIDRVIVENFDRWIAEAAQKGIPLTIDENTTGRRLAETLTQQIALRGDWDPTAAESLKLYEKYLPGYIPPVVETTQENPNVAIENPPASSLAYIATEDELAAIAEDDLYVFSSDDVACFSGLVVPDPDSPTGSTVVYDLQEKWSGGFLSDSELDGMWALADDDPAKALPFGIYYGELNRAGKPISHLFGALRAGDIIADGAYHLYKFQDFVAIKPLEGNGIHCATFHLFTSWQFQIYSLPYELEALTNKKIDFYLSMKVTGDLTCKDKSNLPTYSIDRIIIADRNTNVNTAHL